MAQNNAKPLRFGGGAGPPMYASDETTPLLFGVEAAPLAESAEPAQHHPSSDEDTAAEEEPDADEEKPLPLAQIFLLCFTRIVEPIAFFGIFPYINFMIEKVGNVPTEEVGFWSGLIESLFSATQMCLMIFWGKASDRYGRKPVLVCCLIGIAVCTTFFGLSQSLWQMIVARCCAGVFAGCLVTVRAMLSENSTKYTQARAFSYFAFAGNLGLFIGPILGGVLERPAEKYTSTFGKIEFFHDYPYALPSMVTSAIALFAAITTQLFVKETLHVYRDSKKTNEPPMSTWELLNYPGVSRVILIYSYVMLMTFAYTAVSPVYQYTPINLGGIGFSPQLIAAVTAVAGASQAMWALLVFPPLHKRIGTGGILQCCANVWPFFFASYIVFNILLRHDLRAIFWATAPLALVIGSGIAMAFTALQLAVNDIAPSHATLGTLNAIVLAVVSGIRSFSPALGTSIYATGVKYHILGGHLFWLFNIILGLGLVVLLRVLPEKVQGDVRRQRTGRS